MARSRMVRVLACAAALAAPACNPFAEPAADSTDPAVGPVAGPVGPPVVQGGAIAGCEVETRTIGTAQEAHFAAFGAYATSGEELVAAGMLAEAPELHEIVAPAGGETATHVIVVADPSCGTVGHLVGETPLDV